MYSKTGPPTREVSDRIDFLRCGPAQNVKVLSRGESKVQKLGTRILIAFIKWLTAIDRDWHRLPYNVATRWVARGSKGIFQKPRSSIGMAECDRCWKHPLSPCHCIRFHRGDKNLIRPSVQVYENHDINIAMSSSRADTDHVLGFNIQSYWAGWRDLIVWIRV